MKTDSFNLNNPLNKLIHVVVKTFKLDFVGTDKKTDRFLTHILINLALLSFYFFSFIDNTVLNRRAYFLNDIAI